MGNMNGTEDQDQEDEGLTGEQLEIVFWARRDDPEGTANMTDDEILFWNERENS